ncbi:MAG: sterol desaturase family protein [Myxococcota bacterium]
MRLGAFAGVLALMALWEVVGARRPLALPKSRRWLSNLSLVVLNTVVLRLAFPAAAVGAAAIAAEQGWGVLNWIELPAALAVVASVVLLDLAIYLQHVMFHAVPVLWRLHMVHHADLDFDVTTGLRFHPIEILASMGIKLALVVLIGPPVVGVLIFEVVLNATSMFNHGNVSLPRAVDRVLRWVVVTPDMHRVHHSVEPSETNSNFGFNLPWWDRLLGTYQAEPEAGHDAMTIGVEHLQERRPQGLLWMLSLPFRGGAGSYAINRRRWS